MNRRVFLLFGIFLSAAAAEASFEDKTIFKSANKYQLLIEKSLKKEKPDDEVNPEVERLRRELPRIMKQELAGNRLVWDIGGLETVLPDNGNARYLRAILSFIKKQAADSSLNMRLPDELLEQLNIECAKIDCSHDAKEVLKAFLSLIKEWRESPPGPCPICMDKTSVRVIICDHCRSHFHVNCLSRTFYDLDFYDKDFDCPECHEDLSRAIFLMGEDTLVKRLLLKLCADFKTVLPCRRCAGGVVVAKTSGGEANFVVDCPNCNYGACHKCGVVHPTADCQASIEEFPEESIDTLVACYGEDDVGGCPRCYRVTIKNQGCGLMVCGKSYHTGARIGKSRGCGLRYSWRDRASAETLKERMRK